MEGVSSHVVEPVHVEAGFLAGDDIVEPAEPIINFFLSSDKALNEAQLLLLDVDAILIDHILDQHVAGVLVGPF